MLKIGIGCGLYGICHKCGVYIVTGNEKKAGIGIINVGIGITNIDANWILKGIIVTKSFVCD